MREEQHLDIVIWKEEKYWIYIFSWHQNLVWCSFISTERFLFIPMGSDSSSKDEFNHT